MKISVKVRWVPKLNKPLPYNHSSLHFLLLSTYVVGYMKSEWSELFFAHCRNTGVSYISYEIIQS